MVDLPTDLASESTYLCLLTNAHVKRMEIWIKNFKLCLIHSQEMVMKSLLPEDKVIWIGCFQASKFGSSETGYRALNLRVEMAVLRIGCDQAIVHNTSLPESILPDPE